MTVSVVFAIAGVIALLVGIVGGGIKAKEIEVPSIPSKVRVVTIIVGLALIGATIWLEINKSSEKPPVPTAAAPALSAEPSQPALPTAASLPASVAQGSDPAPTPTKAGDKDLYALLAEAKTWDLILREPFDDNRNGWTLWNVDDDQKTETMQIEDGLLRWGLKIKQPDQWYWEIAPVASYSDFYYSVNVRRIGKPTEEQVAQAIWGMIFRRQGSDFYALLLNDLREYWLSSHGGAGWKDLVGSTKSSVIDLDQSNELAVIVNGPQITAFINGTPVRSFSDSTLSEGNVGFYIGLLHEGDEVQFEFDDFELRQKP